jgi:superoxide reductase
MIIADKLTEGDILKGTKEPETYPVNTAEGGEKHELFIEAPEQVIAGEPFEVIVTVIGIPSITYKQPHIEQTELFIQNKLMGRRELTPLKDEEMESIFKIEVDEALLTIQETSVITNLHALVRCNIHGVSEATQEIEVLPKKYEEIEEVKNVYVKPDDKKFFDKGP